MIDHCDSRKNHSVSWGGKEMEKNQEKVSALIPIIMGIVLIIAGFLIIPKLLEKVNNRVYKSSLSKEDIDFDNMGPEIVLKDYEEAWRNGCG